MEEALKTIRSTHLTLIAICSAILLFSIGPNKSLEYEKALEELNVLIDLHKNGSATIANVIEDSLRGKYIDSLTFYLTLKNYQDSSLERNNFPTQLIAKNSIILPFIHNEMSLADQLEFFEQELMQIKFFNFVDALDNFLDIALALNVDGSLNGWSFEISPDTSKELFLNEESTPVFNIYFVKPENQSKASKESHSFTVIDKTGLAYGFVFTIDSVFQYSSPYFTEDIGLTNSLMILDRYSKLRKDSLWFSSLRPFWNRIQRKTALAAYEWVADKQEKSAGQITLFGLSIKQEVVTLGGPVGIIAVLFYLFLHIGSVNKLISNTENWDGADFFFPWTVLFKNLQSLFVTIFTILILPIFSFIFLNFNYGDLTNITTIIIGFGIISIAITTFKQMIDLRKKLN